MDYIPDESAINVENIEVCMGILSTLPECHYQDVHLHCKTAVKAKSAGTEFPYTQCGCTKMQCHFMKDSSYTHIVCNALWEVTLGCCALTTRCLIALFTFAG